MKRYRRRRVLLAEDNPDDVAIARRALREFDAGPDLIVARDGSEAIECAIGRGEGAAPDLVVLDLNLPKVNGLDVLARLRSGPDRTSAPIIILTASDREEDIRRSYELGANTYVQKPVTYEDFRRALRIAGEYWFRVALLPPPGAPAS